jgi:hypothetical protein
MVIIPRKAAAVNMIGAKDGLSVDYRSQGCKPRGDFGFAGN